ncbi:MAG: hypothetical protein K6G26_10350 [Lachnospiraceae bacterium]|nr:hypothetical protein [Lachnospiraceae bacterium]
MGIFKRLFDSFKKKNDTEKVPYDAEDIIITKYEDEEGRENKKKWLRDNCEQIIAANLELDEVVSEYKIVCSYINDIQKIRFAEKPQRKKIVDAAKQLVVITKEDEKFRNRKQPKMKANQYALIRKNEDIMVDEIEKLEKYEKDCNIVKSDLSKLEGEREVIKSERSNIIMYQKFLKFFSKLVAAVMAIIYLIIGGMYFSKHVNMNIPLAITTFVLVTCVLYIVLVSKRNEYKLELNMRKMNKLISLFNKTKIKYFNSFNLVEYMRSKYDVTGSKELKSLWEKFIKEKEIIKKHDDNAQMYDIYEDKLIKELVRIEVEDSEVWKSQFSAIVNKEEMEEIVDKLNVRYKKLKKRMDYNTNVIEESKNNIKNAILLNDEYKNDIVEILKEYDIVV